MPTRSAIIHWLVSDLRATGPSSQLEGGSEVAQYNGPSPPQGSDPHRCSIRPKVELTSRGYVSLLYAQPDNFTLPASVQGLPAMIGGNRLQFNFTQFVAQAGLGAPLGGGFILSAYDGSMATSGAPFFDSATIGASTTRSGPGMVSTSVATMASGSSARSAGAGPTSAVQSVTGAAARPRTGIAGIAILLAWACRLV